MLFTHLYLMLGEKIEAWFLSPASREYFGVESTAFVSASKFSKRIYPLVRWTAKYVFFINEAMKIAVTFSNSSVFTLCCCCEITQNIVFQLLKNFKVEINFE